RRAVLDRVEPRPVIFGSKFVQEEPRGAGMVLVRAGPEHSVLLVYAFIRDTSIVCDAARTSSPQFIENSTRVVGEKTTLAQALSKRGKDLQVGPHTRRWREGATAEQHPPFAVGHRPFFFCPLCCG